MDLSQATDELLAAPWESFVETRTRLADELARAGKRDDSRALKKIRRPPASAWATNQVVRQQRAAVEAYLAASDELRARQAAMLEGGGDRGAYQGAAEAFRQATASLTQSIRQVLQQGGREPDRAQIEGVMANVRAAALGQAEGSDRRAELLAGRLLADLSTGEAELESVFGASLAAGAAATAPLSRGVLGGKPHVPANDVHPAHRPHHHDAHAEREGDAQAKRAAEARARREEHARRVTAARDEEKAARAAASAATEEAQRALASRDAADERLTAAEASVTKAREALQEAKAAVHAAERAAKERQAVLTRATERRQSLEEQSES
jgi:hypothetical protein